MTTEMSGTTSTTSNSTSSSSSNSNSLNVSNPPIMGGVEADSGIVEAGNGGGSYGGGGDDNKSNDDGDDAVLDTTSSSAVDAPDCEHGMEPDAPIHQFCSQRFDKDLLQQVLQGNTRTEDDIDDDHDENENDDSIIRNDSDGQRTETVNENPSEGFSRQPETIDESVEEEQQQTTDVETSGDGDNQQNQNKNKIEEPVLDGPQVDILSKSAHSQLEDNINDNDERIDEKAEPRIVEQQTADDDLPRPKSPPQQKLKQEQIPTVQNPFDPSILSEKDVSQDHQSSPMIDASNNKDVEHWIEKLANESIHHDEVTNHAGDDNSSDDEANNYTSHAKDVDPPPPPSVSELSTTSAAQRDALLTGHHPPHEILATNDTSIHEPFSTNMESSNGTTQQQRHSRQMDLSPIETEPIQRTSVRSHVTGAPVASNSHHHPAQSGGYVLAHPEIGIPHMPPLLIPQQQPGGQQQPIPTHQQQIHPHQQQQNQQHPIHQGNQFAVQPPMNHTPMNHVLIPASTGGKRRIHLRLVEETESTINHHNHHQPGRSLFSSFRRRKPSIQSPIDEVRPTSGRIQWVDRGTLTVSWYEGTSSTELQGHVRNSIIRKLGLDGTTKLDDYRVLDESVDPPEEIVLCPFIPNESRLLLRFKTRDAGGDKTPIYGRSDSEFLGPPESPSAAPSPHPRSEILHGLGLNANQLALLGSRLQNLQLAKPDETSEGLNTKPTSKASGEGKKVILKPSSTTTTHGEKNDKNEAADKAQEDDYSHGGSNMEVASLHPEDQIQKSLREITDLILSERNGKNRQVPRQEKRQVIFVLANYFVLFLSLIAISAEIQARAPGWHDAMERQLKNVHDCSEDKDTLFQCVENGDLAGLVASVLLWMSRSAATKRIFLFGFESPKKLWTVVYESLVTAVCWGFSYMFIRRGMNPDTSQRFLQKYWKDAMYGSLAGFNAAFMKHVLKNLIPQESIEDALQDRQFKIAFLSWLPSFE